MTRIDFYILSPETRRSIEQLTCQITEKAYLQNNFIYIHSHSVEQANNLDELLWKFKADSFLPHAVYSRIDEQKKDDFDFPVLINCSDNIPQGLNSENRTELLINLTNSTPVFFSQFQRLAEIVDKHEQAKLEARKRFRFYKDRGYQIATHHV